MPRNFPWQYKARSQADFVHTPTWTAMDRALLEARHSAGVNCVVVYSRLLLWVSWITWPSAETRSAGSSRSMIVRLVLERQYPHVPYFGWHIRESLVMSEASVQHKRGLGWNKFRFRFLHSFLPCAAPGTGRKSVKEDM